MWIAFLTSLLLTSTPPVGNWNSEGWKQTPQGWEITATWNTSECSKGSYLVMPPVTNSKQTISLYGSEKRLQGGLTNTENTFYGPAYIKCDELLPGDLEWTVSVPSKYFARITSWPIVQSKFPWQTMFYTTIQNTVALSLVVIGVFVLLAYGTGKQMVQYFFIAACGMSVYFGFPMSLLPLPSLSEISLARIPNVAVWVGVSALLMVLRLRGLLPAILHRIVTVLIVVCAMMTAWARDFDSLYTLAMVPDIPVVFLLLVAAYNAAKRYVNTRTRRHGLELLATVSFCISCFVEGLLVAGHSDIPTVMQIGVLGMLLFLATAIHEDFIQLLIEREYLKSKLEVAKLADKIVVLQRELLLLTEATKGICNTPQTC